MRSFTLGNYRIDVISHSRVFNPGRMQDGVAEAFEIECYENARAFDWYPNSSKPVTGRQTFFWAGKQFQDVYVGFTPAGTQLTDAQVRQRQDRGQPVEFRVIGTKRGADFRTRFFPSIVRRIRKAEAAARLGVTIGDVTEADIDKTPEIEPVDLRGMALNQAVEALTGEPAQISTRVPSGTVANIDVDFDSYAAGDGVETETGTTVAIRFDGDGDPQDFRGQLRFPLSSLPTGATINDADLQVNKTGEGVEAGEDVNIHAYNNTGDDDPNVDNGATKYTRSEAGTALVSFTGNGTGSITVDLGTTADGQIQGNIDSPDRYSLGLCDNGIWEAVELVEIEAIENAGSDPATLIVDYTAAVAFTPRLTLMGVG